MPWRPTERLSKRKTSYALRALRCVALRCVACVPACVRRYAGPGTYQYPCIQNDDFNAVMLVPYDEAPHDGVVECGYGIDSCQFEGLPLVDSVYGCCGMCHPEIVVSGDYEEDGDDYLLKEELAQGVIDNAEGPCPGECCVTLYEHWSPDYDLSEDTL
jgi:hypothetical protein